MCTNYYHCKHCNLALSMETAMLRKWKPVVAAFSSATLLAACSSSGSGPGGAAANPGGATSGPPIHIMEISGTEGPVAEGAFARPGIEAAVKAINAAGGIRGRPVDLELCDDQSMLSQAAACADEAASDKSIIATVSNNTQMTPAIDPVLAQAKLAAVASIPYTPSDFTCPVVFPSEGGGLAITAGENEFPARMGLKKIAFMVFDTSGGAAATTFVNSELQALYHLKVDSVLVPATTTDITSSVAAAIAKHPDAVSLAIPQNLSIAATNQLRAQGYTGMIIGPAEAMSPAALKHISDPGKLYLTGSYAYSSPAYQTFQQEMRRYEPAAEVNDYALSAWVGMQEFADVMSKSSQPLTRAGVLAAFSSESHFTMRGLIPALDYTRPNPITAFARLINMTQVLHEVTRSGTVDVKPVQFVDMLTGNVMPTN